MLNITNYYKNTDRNSSEVSPHNSQNGHNKKKKSTNSKFWRGCGEKGIPLHRESVKRYSHRGEKYGGSFRN